MSRELFAAAFLSLGPLFLLACDSASDDVGGGAGSTTTPAAGGGGFGTSGGDVGGIGAAGVGGGGGSGTAGQGGSGAAAGGAAGGAAGAGGHVAAGGTGGAPSTGGSGGAVSDGVLDVSIFVANNCDVTTTPASITVPEGTSFTVNWLNLGSSASAVDVDKVDQYNQVPIVIGLEPGESYHDTVREWCGTIFTGTFSFRVTGCYEPYWLDVDCGG